MVDPVDARPPRLRRNLLRTLGVAAGVAVLLGALYAGVPAVLQHVLETDVAALAGRAIAVRHIAFNPLTLAARIDGLTVQSAQPGAAPLLAVDTLTLQVSPASIWRLAPVLDHVTIVHPHVSLVRNDDGSYSVQDLIDAALAERGGDPARFSLNNIEVQNGEIDFDDRPRQRMHSIRALSIGIPFLSSLPYATEVKVVPHVFARVNGSPFSLAGTTTPFGQSRDASLDIDVDALPLAEYAAYLPVKLRAKIVSGTMSSHAKLVFSEGDPQSRSLWLSGEFTLDDLALQRQNGADAVSVAHASAHVGRLDVLSRTLVIDALRIERPVLDARRAPDGRLDIAEPWIDTPPAAAPSSAETTARWEVVVEKAALEDGVVRVVDSAVRPVFRATYSGVTLDATDLSTIDSKRAHLRIAMAGDSGASAHADVDFIPATLEATGHVAVDKLSLRRFYPYYADALNLDVQSGTLSIAGDFASVPDAGGPKLAISAGMATLDDLQLALHAERAPMWHVPRVALSGIVVDVHAHSVDIGRLESRDGVLAIRRGADGAVNFARLLKTTPDTGRAPPPKDATWSVRARDAVVDRYVIDLDDEAPATPVAYHLRNVHLAATNLSNARGKRAQVALHATVDDGGALTLEGPLVTNPFGASLRVDASALALAPLQPYLDPHVNATVTAGTAAANGRLSLGLGEDPDARADDRTRWTGSVTISDFVALDTPTHNELVHWKRLALDNVEIAPSPFRLDIGAASLEDFFARVIVHEDATLNFMRLRKSGANADASAGTIPPPPADALVAGRAPAAGAGAVTLGNVAFVRGEVRYSDYYVRPNYSAHLTGVAGTVSAMSALQGGTVDVTAKVEGSAPVAIKGVINPFARAITLDLTGNARGIDLPPLSPYATKYAGYPIVQGKLSFDVHYRIQDRKLVADNKVMLDQLLLGEHVDTPTATTLPVPLALALLKDANGVIDLDLPVAGSLDDPRFSVSALIGKALGSLLQKAASAPFALLGAAFGAGEELSFLTFEPGTATPTAAADGKLATLGKALATRPSLKVDIAGHVDAHADAEALRHESVERALRVEKFKALAAAGTPAVSPDAVSVTPDERLRYLTAAYKSAPIAERPRNFLGILKDVPRAEMEAMLYDSTSVGDDVLRHLAGDRAQAVKRALVERGIAPARLVIVESTPTSPKDAPAARADLALR